jgi:hypothetical protein
LIGTQLPAEGISTGTSLTCLLVLACNGRPLGASYRLRVTGADQILENRC